ncbi:MAG: PD-(D/E)XK nuclease family protein [Treponema sp.]|nr:PD-(D/E)XK nuclease family protein [Treponema sp.]
MNSVESVLLENIDAPNSCFIFPTDVAASRWADHLLRLRGGTIAMKKFIAWDVFKQNSIKSKVLNKKSIPSVLRKVFISALIKENAQEAGQGKAPFFVSLIRPQWAQQADRFAPWLTGLLPQLGIWFNKTTGMKIDSILLPNAEDAALEMDDDDRDLFLMARRYAQFLEKHRLFEPAWETPPFNDEGLECFVFFPESLSDYSEYRELLASSAHVKIISSLNAEANPGDTFYYTNSRSEITEAALYIRALHEKSGISWDSIAVCIPYSENYEPYVIREFTNRNIPHVKRSSKPLADYPAGQFFSAVVDCTSRGFAFSALTSLIMNRNLPWKDTASIHNLVEFGINNNCISSWTEKSISDGKEQLINVNVWEDAFNQPYKWIDPAAKTFFINLKRHLYDLRYASSFSQVRKQYFIFRQCFFNMEECTEETDLILSRCISELIYLTEIEKNFPEAVFDKSSGASFLDSFLFFTQYLSETNYLAQQKSCGVNILPYKTAASAPFDCHIILGAGHDALSIVYSRLDFLSRKKREKLGVSDEDASFAFINLHRINSIKNAAFFCCEQSFSGYTIPHSKIDAQGSPQERCAANPQLREKFSVDYYKNEYLFNPLFSTSDNAFPITLHENQKDGFEEWKKRRKYPESSGGKWKTDNVLLDLIQKKYMYNDAYPGLPGVSASAMEPYFQCSLKWLFNRVLSLENVQIEVNLMAENVEGMVYHAVLNLFFTEIKKTKKVLIKPDYSDHEPVLPASYREILKDCVNKIFSAFPSLQTEGEENKTHIINHAQMSALTSRLLFAGKKHFLFSLEKFLAHFLSLFAGHYVFGCEIPYQVKRDNYFLNGKIDFILEEPDKTSDELSGKNTGKLIIADFKLKWTPERDDCTAEGKNGLANFQIPMYTILTEENNKAQVHTALFYSILKLYPEVIIGEVNDIKTNAIIPKNEDKRISRNSAAYNRIFEEFSIKTRQFANEINTGNFTVFETGYNKCVSCKFSRICRTAYTISCEKYFLPENIQGK